jgi:hypothetical protein
MVFLNLNFLHKLLKMRLQKIREKLGYSTLTSYVANMYRTIRKTCAQECGLEPALALHQSGGIATVNACFFCSVD